MILRWSFLVFLISFSVVAQKRTISSNRWFCQLQIQDKTIDFILEQKPTRIFPSQYRLVNGKETIDLDFNRVEGDSLICPISIYDSELRFPAKVGPSFSGRFVKNDTKIPDYFLPFKATEIKPKPAIRPASNQKPFLQGKWSLDFSENGLEKDPAFGVFTQKGDSIFGSILTETGDYRFLNGMQTDARHAYVQSFNGAQTYLFEFALTELGVTGVFYISKTRKIEFKGSKTVINPLSDGFSKSKVIGNERFRFKARNLEGGIEDENSALIRGKPLVVQILGSWCPNCLDETRFLTEVFPHRPAGVEFIGLAFERKSDFNYAKNRVETIKNRLEPPYPIWIGGFASTDSAAKVLPALTGIAAFPTTIFVKASGQVHKVHTGFSGPATGIFYEVWKKEFNQLLKEISEP